MTPERLREFLDAVYGTHRRPVGWSARFYAGFKPGTLILTDDEAKEVQQRRLGMLMSDGLVGASALGREAWKALP